MDAALTIIENTLSADRIIEGIVDAETAHDAIDTMDKLKKMLDLADQYEKYATQYLVAECKMWFAIVDAWKADPKGDPMAFFDGLKQRQQKLIHWINTFDEAQREFVLNECMHGKSIESQRQQKVACDNLVRSAQDYEYASSEIVRRCLQTGRTTCSIEGFLEDWHGRIPKTFNGKVAKACVEKARDELLRAGAVGLGDGKGTYVMVSNMTMGEAMSAILTRVKAIKADIGALRKLRDMFGAKLPDEEAAEVRAAIHDLLSTIEDELAVE